MSYIDDLYHNCRHCHWFDLKTECCLHGDTFSSGAQIHDGVLLMAEDGVISDAITEGFSDKDFSTLKRNLELSGLSKKKQREIYGAFLEELAGVISDWTTSIDDAVVTAITNHVMGEHAGLFTPAPDQPDEFYCKYYE